jgi:hypothetical protein
MGRNEDPDTATRSSLLWGKRYVDVEALQLFGLRARDKIEVAPQPIESFLKRKGVKRLRNRHVPEAMHGLNFPEPLSPTTTEGCPRFTTERNGFRFTIVSGPLHRIVQDRVSLLKLEERFAPGT